MKFSLKSFLLAIFVLSFLTWQALAVAPGSRHGLEAEDNSIPGPLTSQPGPSELPFSLNGLFIGCSQDEIVNKLGKSQKDIAEGFSMYSENATVRMRDSKVVNRSVGKPSRWVLSQGKNEILVLGDPRQLVLQRLGKPYAVYVHPQKPISIMLYPKLGADIGIFIVNDQIDGFMMTEPGYLGNSLQYGGYVIEAEP